MLSYIRIVPIPRTFYTQTLKGSSTKLNYKFPPRTDNNTTTNGPATTTKPIAASCNTRSNVIK